MSSEESNKMSQETHLQDSLYDAILEKSGQEGNPFAEMLWANEKKKAMQNVSSQTKKKD